MIVTFFSMQFLNPEFLTFNELRELQSLTQSKFETKTLKIGFKFSHSKIDEFWKSKIYVYEPKADDDLKSLTRIERVVDTVYFGKKRNVTLIIVTVSIITDEESYYAKLLAQCKENGYTSWGTNNYDRYFPNMKVEEYRKADDIAKFSIGVSKSGEKFYKISISHSPK
jgi:hypothetical protein